MYIRNTGQLKLHKLRTLDVATEYCDAHPNNVVVSLHNREFTGHTNIPPGVNVLGIFSTLSQITTR